MEINLAIIDFNPGQGGGVNPSGTLDISENGVYNVYTYASASVDVHPSASLSETYISKSKFDNARQAVASIVLDSYYTFCHPSWKSIETQEYRDKAEKCFAEYFKKWEYLWKECPDQVKMQISSGIRQREVIQGMEMETETLEQFLTRMRRLGENQ